MDINEIMNYFEADLDVVWANTTIYFLQTPISNLLQILATSMEEKGIFVIVPELHYIYSVLEYINLGFLQLEVLVDISRICFSNGRNN